MTGSEKGKFTTDIGNDVIDEALRSVRQRTEEGVALDVEAQASPPEAPASDDVRTEQVAAVARPAPGEDPADAPTPAEPLPAVAAAPEAPAGPPPPTVEEHESLKAQLELSLAKGREMMERIRDTHEKMLRAVADLENFKKRAQKEREEVQRFGVERLLRDVLPVADNLDRALEHAKTASDFDGLRTGVQMTRKQFDDALGRHGVKPFSAKGLPFDPRMHEAMQQVETAELPPNHVYAEVLRGYTLSERLFRPALVMVSKAKPAAAEGGSEGPPPGGAEGTPAP